MTHNLTLNVTNNHTTNLPPHFETHLPENLYVSFEDGTIFEYLSPQAVDPEGGEVRMELELIESSTDAMQVFLADNNTFGIEATPNTAGGVYELQITIYDNLNASSTYLMKVHVNDTLPNWPPFFSQEIPYVINITVDLTTNPV